jgi:2-hydroxy-4-carboxymuconate semialdehyde hemiacetal dehydrogenase
MRDCQTQRCLQPLARLRRERAARPIRHIAVRLVLDRTTNVGITGRGRSWTDDIVWHHGSHAVDSALWLLGEPIAEVAALGAGRSESGTPLDAGIVLRARSGALATIALSYSAQRPSTDFMVICEGVTYQYGRGVLTSSEGLSESWDETELFAEAVRSQDTAFVDAVAAGRPTSPGPGELVAVYDVLRRVSDLVAAPRR